MADDGYTTEPTHLRAFVEDGPDGDRFTLDGADDDGRYTEGCWSGFDSIGQALDEAERFIEATTADGVRWQWNPDRPKGLRRAPRWGSGTEDGA